MNKTILVLFVFLFYTGCSAMSNYRSNKDIADQAVARSEVAVIQAESARDRVATIVASIEAELISSKDETQIKKLESAARLTREHKNTTERAVQRAAVAAQRVREAIDKGILLNQQSGATPYFIYSMDLPRTYTEQAIQAARSAAAAATAAELAAHEAEQAFYSLGYP